MASVLLAVPLSGQMLLREQTPRIFYVHQDMTYFPSPLLLLSTGKLPSFSFQKSQFVSTVTAYMYSPKSTI
jgi:hypothetical protein